MIEENNFRIYVSSDFGLPERRKHPRYPFTASAEIVEPISQARIQGRTSDLSRGGCYVDAGSCFPAGSIVVVRLTREMRFFEAQAEIAYSIDGMGMGVKFTDAVPEQFSTLESWVAELSGDLQPERSLPQPTDPSCVHRSSANEEHIVLNELVMELRRQGLLSNSKCDAMLQRLNRAGRVEPNSVAPEPDLTGLFPM